MRDIKLRVNVELNLKFVTTVIAVALKEADDNFKSLSRIDILKLIKKQIALNGLKHFENLDDTTLCQDSLNLAKELVKDKLYKDLGI